MAQTFELDTIKYIAYVHGKPHPFVFGEVIPHPWGDDKTYTFTDELGEQANGVIIEVAPRQATQVVRIAHQATRFEDIAIEGAGWWVGIDTDGNVEVYEMGPHLKDNPLIVTTFGMTYCFVAGDSKLIVADVTTPPWNPSVEEIIPENDSRLPEAFWQTRANLLGLSNL